MYVERTLRHKSSETCTSSYPTKTLSTATGYWGNPNFCCFGTRDAAKGWQETLSFHLESIGCSPDVSSEGEGIPVWHPKKQIKTSVHGDDYASAGDDISMAWLEEELSKAYEIQTQKLGMDKDNQHEGQVLNRIIRCMDVGWEMRPIRDTPNLWSSSLGSRIEASALQDCQKSMRRMTRETSHWRGMTSPDTEGFRSSYLRGC